MNYYQLKHSTSPQTIGKNYPQILSFADGFTYDRDSPQSVTKVYSWSPLLKALLVPKYKLEYKAKRTDLLSTAVQNPTLLVISEKMYAVLSTFKIPEHNVFEAEVISRGKTLKYMLFYMPPMPIHFTQLENENMDYDLFRMEKPVKGYFLNEKVVSAFNEANITGVDFQPIEKVKQKLLRTNM